MRWLIDLFRRFAGRLSLPVAHGEGVHVIGDVGSMIAELDRYAFAHRSAGSTNELVGLLENQLQLLFEVKGDLEQALPLAIELERLGREVGDERVRCLALNRLAVLRYRMGDVVASKKLFREQETACLAAGNAPGVDAARWSLARIEETDPGKG